jgi:hypothetical protein
MRLVFFEVACLKSPMKILFISSRRRAFVISIITSSWSITRTGVVLSPIKSKTMKILISFFLSLCFVGLRAQSYEGKWTGNVQNANGVLNAEMNLKNNATRTQLSGTLLVENAGSKDQYIIDGKITNNTMIGTLKYQDGTIFPFEMALVEGTISQKIYYNKQVILEGSYQKYALKKPIEATKKDGLYRDPNLVGHWTHHENYSSSGGFYGGSSSSIVLFADGRIGDGGSESYVSGPNSSGSSSGSSTIDKVSASGARWFTKGSIFYWRVNVNGQTKDIANSKYFIKDGALLLTDLQTGKKMLYYRK